MTDYLLSRREAPDLERTRLELLAAVHDPLTIAQLDAIGVGEGWRCLDDLVTCEPGGSALRDNGVTTLAVPVPSLIAFVILSGILGLLAATWPARARQPRRRRHRACCGNAFRR